MTADGAGASSPGDGAAAEQLLAQLFKVGGSRALVTGAASGLGHAMAEVLAQCGAEVTLADVDPRVEDAAQELRGAGLQARSLLVDVGDRERATNLLAGAAAELGGLDVVVANAGISAGPGPLSEEGRIERVDPAMWDRVIAVNLTGVFTTVQATVPALRRAGGGRVIVTASIAGLSGERHVGYAYAASKAAVVNFVRQAALELAQYGIRINAIAPGPFRTALAARRSDRHQLEADFVRDVSLRRMAEPHEIRGLTLLLASDASSYMTGAVIPVDGGTTAVHPG